MADLNYFVIYTIVDVFLIISLFISFLKNSEIPRILVKILLPFQFVNNGILALIFLTAGLINFGAGIKEIEPLIQLKNYFSVGFPLLFLILSILIFIRVNKSTEIKIIKNKNVNNKINKLEQCKRLIDYSLYSNAHTVIPNSLCLFFVPFFSLIGLLPFELSGIFFVYFYYLILGGIIINLFALTTAINAIIRINSYSEFFGKSLILYIFLVLFPIINIIVLIKIQKLIKKKVIAEANSIENDEIENVITQ